jgi:hypothetical protein
MYLIARAFGKGWYVSFFGPGRVIKKFERPLCREIKRAAGSDSGGPFLIRILSLLIRAIRNLLPFIERPQICRTPLQKAVLNGAIKINCVAIDVLE